MNKAKFLATASPRIKPVSLPLSRPVIPRHSIEIMWKMRFWRLLLAVFCGLGSAGLFLWIGASPIRAQGPIYVNDDAPGPTHNGLSWTTAYTNVQDALSAAGSGDEIWVAAGVYYPDEGIGQTDNDRNSTFQLVNGVALYGGFAGTENALGQRNWTANITVLSGDIDQNDTSEASGVITDTDNISGSNAYNVIRGNSVDATTILDGFIVTGGQADGPTTDLGRGGGLYGKNNNRPIVQNVIFSGNWADDGGGMYNSSTSNPTMQNVTFTGNAAQYGGGMYNDFFILSGPTLINITFTGNRANSDGGGMYNNSGGSFPSMTNVIFSGNTAMMGGGGVYNYNTDSTLTNVTFSGNRAYSGGGMYNVIGSDPTLVNAIFWGNISEGTGKQIENQSGTLVISHSLIQDSNGSGGSWDTSLGTDAGNNLDSNPLFVRDPDPGDGDWTTLADNDYGDLHLQTGSPALNAGSNSAVSGVATDLAGNPRILDGTVDLGAFEHPAGPIYVNDDAPGPTHDGLSWTTAYTNVQDALSAADSGDPIWVAAGVYYPDEGAGQTDNDRNSTFQLVNGVALYGGFAGTESVLDQRDWTVNIAVLSGDIDQNDTTDASGIITNTANINGDNAYQVVTGSGTDNTAVLDGFTVTGGRADGAYISACGTACGGGMYNEGGSPVVQNVSFRANSTNSRGGGMANFEGSNPVLTNLSFSANLAGNAGGGMTNEYNSNPSLINVIFTNNIAGGGGGMFNNGNSNSSLTNVIFSANRAAEGGGMANETSTPILTNVTFTGNTANINGGGIDNDTSTPVLTNVILWGNTANNSGDQVFNDRSMPVISYSLVQGGLPAGSSDGGHNLDVDPLFARLPDPGLDGTWGTDDDDYGDLRLLPGSPAIDSGDNGNCPATDQRGLPRSDGHCDRGAFEAQGFSLTLTGGDQQSTMISTPFALPLALNVSSAAGESVGPGGVIRLTAPATGASISPAMLTATTNTTGAVSVMVTANAQTGGPYQVVAEANGVEMPLEFSLTNLAEAPPGMYIYLPLLLK